MKRSLIVFVVLLTALAAAVEQISVAHLTKDPDKYNAKKVVVVGAVDEFKQKTSRAGNPYFTFNLIDKVDKKQKVSIYSKGKLDKELKKGAIVEVTGEYLKEKKVGNMTFKNEIETKPDQIKPSK